MFTVSTIITFEILTCLFEFRTFFIVHQSLATTQLSILRLVQKFNNTGSVDDLAEHRVTIRHQSRYVRIIQPRDRNLQVRAIARWHGKPISDQTIRNRLREEGFRAR